MRDRHWQQITEKAQSEVAICPDMKNFSLQTFIELGLLESIDMVTAVAECAGKEFSLEKQIQKMKQDWAPIEFDLKEKYRNTGTYILKGSDEAMVLLDEH